MLEFTWGRFAVAAINFLLLVVILYKLLHKPLLAVLARRQKAIEAAHKAAEEEAEEARQMQEEYAGKLATIKKGRDGLLAEARQKAEAAREDLIRKAQREAAREVANLKRDWERHRRDAMDAVREEIVEVSLELARHVLRQLTDTDVEARLHAQLRQELEGLAADADEQTRRSLFAAGGPVRVVSAAALEEEERREIEERIGALSDDPVELSFETDEDLIAGTRVEFSSQAIDASLADVLAAARERFEQLAPEPEGEEERP